MMSNVFSSRVRKCTLRCKHDDKFAYLPQLRISAYVKGEFYFAGIIT